jgi:adenylate cyclase
MFLQDLNSQPRTIMMSCRSKRRSDSRALESFMPGRPSLLRISFQTLIFGVGAGLLYNFLIRQASYPSTAMIYGLCTASCMIAYESGLVLGGLRRRIQLLPSLPHILLSDVVLVALIAFGHSAAGLIAWSTGLISSWRDALMLPLDVVVYSLIISAIFVFVMRLRNLIGAEVFRNLLLGRYYRPVTEERIFLLIDMVGSSAYAERHGDLRAQEYLGAIFASFAEPVRRYRGAIDDYIGDMAMITWPRERGAKDAACVACLFTILDDIARNAESWRRSFGQVPQLRAALHGGSIVTAEIGVDRHKIAYFGDVVNTTARLEALSRGLGAQVLISDELLQRVRPLPPRIQARALGYHAIRGRDQILAVSALALMPPQRMQADPPV